MLPPRRTAPPAWVERLEAVALPIFGSTRVVRARRVIDRYNAGGGGLLAAGIAYNTLFALVPLALFAGGLLGLFISDPATLQSIRDLLTDWAPPLADIVDEVLDGLSTASPTLSAIGFVGLVWGSTRLYASLELGIEAMFAGAPRRGFVAKTVRRIVSIVVIAAVVALSFVAISVASLVSEVLANAGDATAFAISIGFLALPVLVTTAALATIYLLVPPVRPDASAMLWPTFVTSLALVLLTRAFTIVAPRILGANFVYGTLGAIFVALAWLGVVYTLLLVAAAWIRERMLAEEGSAEVV
ncbi:MAG TPA: YihY/virulence factor BrkB family protein [Candidatus Limnocylindrales bacterium]|nr:YihY/virulence factor BrkB family protein [Candidatus Limnocylindrales bacterium]